MPDEKKSKLWQIYVQLIAVRKQNQSASISHSYIKRIKFFLFII